MGALVLAQWMRLVVAAAAMVVVQEEEELQEVAVADLGAVVVAVVELMVV